MKFSIIVPVKNEISSLRRTLPQFARLKGRFEYELIVADGKSDDGSIEYAQTVADKVMVKTKAERETIAEGRNRGAAVATGDVLVFLDAGVLVDNITRFFEELQLVFSDPRIVAATTNVRIYPEQENWQDKIVHAAVNGIVRLWNFFGWGAGKGEVQLIRRSAFERVGRYNDALVAAEDNDLYSRLAKAGKIVFLKDLQVFDDPRRYRKLGYLRVITQWILNQFSVRLFRRSYSKEWKRVD